jgi:hypothetical protein
MIRVQREKIKLRGYKIQIVCILFFIFLIFGGCIQISSFINDNEIFYSNTEYPMDHDSNNQGLIDIPINEHQSQSNYLTRNSKRNLDLWGMSDLELTNPNNPNMQHVYVGFGVYNFRFTIDPLSAFANVTAVTFEPTDESVSHTWHRSRTPEGLTSTSKRGTKITSAYYTLSTDLGFLDFNITFGWKRSVNDLNPSHLYKITIHDNNSKDSSFDQWINYFIIRDAKFIGNLKVEGAHQGIINNNDWVRANEGLTWTGLRVVYNTTTNFELPEEQYLIEIHNSDGDSWTDQSVGLEDMIVNTDSKPVNDYGDEHIINISGPAKDNLIKPIKFIIRVDADGIKFYNQSPKGHEWKNENLVECNITISDNLTSGVDKDSIEYQFSTDGGKVFSNWLNPEIEDIDDPKIILGYDLIRFVEGEGNRIQWRGKDLVGNSFTSSDIFAVNVDKTPLAFKNPQPPDKGLVYSTEVECSIDIADTLSGIDISSIQYSISLDGGAQWSPWKKASDPGGSSTNLRLITVKTIENFEFGELNYIKWRAKDRAGNGYTNSKEIQIRITHKVPRIHLLSPIPGELVNTTQPTLSWQHSYEILQPVKYTIQYWPANDPENVEEVEISELSYTLEKKLKYDTRYQWQVTPKTNEGIVGTSDSGIWNFTINKVSEISPIFKFDVVILPDFEVTVSPKKSAQLEFIYSNKGNRDDVYEILFLYDPVWDGFVEYEDNISVPLNGSHTSVIKIRVPDSGWQYKKSYVFIIEINSSGAKEFNQNETDFRELYVNIIKDKETIIVFPAYVLESIIIFIVLLILILGTFYYQKKRRKYKDFESKYKPPPTTHKGEAEIVFKPEHKRAVDRSSKDDLITKPKT